MVAYPIADPREMKIITEHFRINENLLDNIVLLYPKYKIYKKANQWGLAFLIIMKLYLNRKGTCPNLNLKKGI